MAQFIVNETKSYTLVASIETGNVKLVLDEGLAEKLKAAAEEASSPEAATGAFLDILGEDATAYLEAIGELAGVGGDFAQAYAEGGQAGLADMIGTLAAAGNGDFFNDALAKGRGESDYFDQFVDATGTDVADVFGFGPQFSDAFAEEGSDEGKAAIEEMLGNRDGGISWGYSDAAEDRIVGAAIGGAIGGAGFGLIVAGSATFGIAALPGAAAGAVGGLLGGVIGQVLNEEATYEPARLLKEEVDFTPADPNDDVDTSGLIGIFDPDEKMAEDIEQADATYGTILVDPNAETGAGASLKAFDPDAELDSLILTDPEDVQQAITGAEVKAAVDLKLETTTTPVDAVDVEFDFSDFGGVTGGAGGGLMAAEDDGVMFAEANVAPGALDLQSDTEQALDAELVVAGNYDSFDYM